MVHHSLAGLDYKDLYLGRYLSDQHISHCREDITQLLLPGFDRSFLSENCEIWKSDDSNEFHTVRKLRYFSILPI